MKDMTDIIFSKTFNRDSNVEFPVVLCEKPAVFQDYVVESGTIRVRCLQNKSLVKCCGCISIASSPVSTSSKFFSFSSDSFYFPLISLTHKQVTLLIVIVLGKLFKNVSSICS